jgi:hypothetical protein
MDAHLARIREWNPRVNALVGLLPDDACRDMAREADARLARGDGAWPLAGLPIAFKDLHEAAGLVFTRGSAIYRDTIGITDSVLAARLRAAGALPIAKTNVPEFGLGSHTFNPVWGPTRNPYDLTRSAGGSSGGAGAALATGMLPGAGRAAQARLWRERPDGAQRGRRRVAARRDGRTRSARSRLPDAEARGPWRSTDRRHRTALPRRVESGSARLATGTRRA